MTDKLKMLGRDDILSADDFEREMVDVPEWGGSVWVRTLSGAERDAFGVSCLPKKGKDKGQELLGVRARLVTLTACDENGERLFKRADEDALGKKSGMALSRVFDVASRLNGLSEDDVAELEGN